MGKVMYHVMVAIVLANVLGHSANKRIDFWLIY